MKKDVKQAIDNVYANIQRIAAGLHQYKIADSLNDDKTKREILESMTVSNNEVAAAIEVMRGGQV